MLSGDAIAHAPGISPLHDVKKSAGSPYWRAETVLLPSNMDAAPAAGTFQCGAQKAKNWWSQTGSNRRPEACKATALPAELWPRSVRPNATAEMVGLGRFELPTSRLSSARSNQLSYRPAGADASQRSLASPRLEHLKRRSIKHASM